MASTSLPLSSDNKKLLIFDFQTQKWTDWVSEPGGASPFLLGRADGQYVYYNSIPKTRHIAGSKSDRPALNYSLT